MKNLSPAELLLKSLGIVAPEEIDLDAIACHMGILAVRTRSLDGCDARLVGVGNNAIISVKASALPQRRRFSICHELGHWHLHRGQVLYCTAADIGDRDVAQTKEKEANRFAADLLLPPYILRPILDVYGVVNVKVVDEVRTIFRASRSAAAIQLVKLHRHPIMVAFNSPSGKRWQVSGPAIPRGLITRSDIGPESWAFNMLHGSAPDQPQPRRVRADIWFDRRGAERFRVLEQSFSVGDNAVATLISFEGAELFEAYADGW